MLSPTYRQIKLLRSTGKCAAAHSLLGSTPPDSDEDAFEAAVCLFVCGDFAAVQHVCQTRTWREDWARRMAQAMSIMVANGDPAQALALARRAIDGRRAGYDASAVFLMLLQANGLIDEARSFIERRFQDPPPNETLLLTIMGEIALAVQDWVQAYKLASAVIAADPDDFRALLTLSHVNYGIDHIHEALGNALRANLVIPGSQPTILQIMRCQNKVGDYYAAIGTFSKLADQNAILTDIQIELGMAYAGAGDTARATAAYRAALACGERPIAAIRALVSIFASSGDRAELSALESAYPAEIHGDIECLPFLGKEALARRDLVRAARIFEESFALAKNQGAALEMLPWPVPEPRIRHDYEQLELLEQRGLLGSAGRDALRLLKRYYDQTGDVLKTFAPSGSEGDAMRSALSTVHHCCAEPFSGTALGENDYDAIEQAHFSARPSVVVIDNFLSPAALAALRRYCEESTIWKLTNNRGYVGTLLGQGFSSPVLLKIADELRHAMPRVIGIHALTQAWAFKYDQRMQGIDMHADFAKINVNFWITPDEACEDNATGGMIVYDLPVPTHWTFTDFNTHQSKMKAFLDVHGAKPIRVPYRANRCVLFDSSLIHITDELHFKPGYANRRVNVTLLYGQARSIG